MTVHPNDAPAMAAARLSIPNGFPDALGAARSGEALLVGPTRQRIDRDPLMLTARGSFGRPQLLYHPAMMYPRRTPGLIAAALLGACAPTTAARPAVPAAAAPAAALTSPSAASFDAFLERLRRHCGKAYAGRVVVNKPPQPDDAFAGKILVMHVRECGERELKIPFHVGNDHSRTWVLTRTATGLRLKHDHRHEDGSEDVLTMYGGETAAPGSETRQEFPVDAGSIALFKREGLTASMTNTWAMVIEPGQRFLYELSRPGGRLFQVEFDLTTPVDAPPPPWGHSPAGSR
jgi:hypothetical protein